MRCNTNYPDDPLTIHKTIISIVKDNCELIYAFEENLIDVPKEHLSIGMPGSELLIPMNPSLAKRILTWLNTKSTPALIIGSLYNSITIFLEAHPDLRAEDMIEPSEFHAHDYESQAAIVRPDRITLGLLDDCDPELLEICGNEMYEIASMDLDKEVLTELMTAIAQLNTPSEDDPPNVSCS